jgi:hypothetical protein
VRRVCAIAVAIGVVLGAASGCDELRRTPRARVPPPWPWAEPRAAYFRRSQLWIGGDLVTWVRHMRTLDLAAGPAHVVPGTVVDCAYVEAEPGHFSGVTPKFVCRPGREPDEVKVKYGAENPEIYAEVAGSRLMWALGFAADRVDPVRVRCTGCSDDPWRDPSAHPGRVVLFDPATMEHQAPGRTIEEEPHQGWTWAEFDTIDAAAGGAPRAHVDAYKLLAAFVQHRDSKGDNQRLLCPPDAFGRSAAGLTCRRPIAMIDDEGSFFGGSRWHVATYKMSLDAWEKRPVWADARHCIADVSGEWDALEGLVRPHIGEDGRRFLAALLGGLDHMQIVALYAAARAEDRGGVERWVAAFEARRDQIAHPIPSEPGFRCPDVVPDEHAEHSAPSPR